MKRQFQKRKLKAFPNQNKKEIQQLELENLQNRNLKAPKQLKFKGTFEIEFVNAFSKSKVKGNSKMETERKCPNLNPKELSTSKFKGTLNI